MLVVMRSLAAVQLRLLAGLQAQLCGTTLSHEAYQLDPFQDSYPSLSLCRSEALWLKLC